MDDHLVCVGYLRYSSHKQDDGMSLEIQESVIRMCAEKLHCTVKIFADPATSANRYAAPTRKGMRDMMQYSKKNQPRYLLYAAEDRLSRLGDDFVLDVYNEILQYSPSCELVNAQQGRVIDPHELEGVLRFASSFEENMQRSARAIAAQDTMLKAGMHPGQHPNYGYKYNSEDNVMEVEPETADIVHFIFHLAAWGTSFQTICTTLNESKVPSPARRNWTKASLHAIVRNPIYMGTPRWSLNPLSRIDNEKFQTSLISAIRVDPVVSPLTWHRANDLVCGNKRARKIGSPYLLRDLLKCRNCDSKAGVLAKDYTSARAERPNRVYRCESCGRHASIESVHDTLIPRIQSEWYGRLFPQADRVDKWFQQIGAQLERKIRDLEQKHRFLETFNSNPQIHDEISLRLIQKEMHNTRDLAERVEAFAREPMQYYKTVERWGSLDFWGLSIIEQRRFLIEVVDCIVYDFDGKNAPEIRYFPGPDICTEADHVEFTQNRQSTHGS